MPNLNTLIAQLDELERFCQEMPVPDLAIKNRYALTAESFRELADLLRELKNYREQFGPIERND